MCNASTYQTCSGGVCSLTCPVNTTYFSIQETACGNECCLGSCNGDNTACAYDSTNCLNGGTPSCQGSVCGLDPVCGILDCGTCPPNATCVLGQCVCKSMCTASSKCGDPDGCGGTCGPPATCTTGTCTCLGGQCSLTSGTYICSGCNYQGQIGTGCQGTDTCFNNLGGTCSCSPSSGCQGSDTCANGNPGGTCSCPTCPQGQFCSAGTCTNCPLNNSANCLGTNSGCLDGQVISPNTNTCCTPTVDCSQNPCSGGPNNPQVDNGCGVDCPNICGTNYTCDSNSSNSANCGGHGQCPPGTACTCGNCSACQGPGASCPPLSGCCLQAASCDGNSDCSETCNPYNLSGSAGSSSSTPSGETATCICDPSTGQSNWQFTGAICSFE